MERAIEEAAGHRSVRVTQPETRGKVMDDDGGYAEDLLKRAYEYMTDADGYGRVMSRRLTCMALEALLESDLDPKQSNETIWSLTDFNALRMLAAEAVWQLRLTEWDAGSAFAAAEAANPVPAHVQEQIDKEMVRIREQLDRETPRGTDG